MSADLKSCFGGAFRGQRVLLTGHTGFKGAWLAYWLLSLDAEVFGLALEPDTAPSLFEDIGLAEHIDHRIGDIRDASVVDSAVRAARPDLVLHLAAQPLVRRSYAEPVYTFDTNVMGTVNLLEALRSSESVRSIVCVTTDKVYANPETGHPFPESAPLGGHDPYSASKAACEIAIQSYRSAFYSAQGTPAVASGRAGNVIGGGDWAEDRILPDCVRALARGEQIVVRNPQAVRPWQHVLEPLSGYLHLAAVLMQGGHAYAEAFNFGPDPSEHYQVSDVVERAIEAWGEGSWTHPRLVDQPHEAGLLSLDVTKAEERLGWAPVWDFGTTVDRTVHWYRSYKDDAARVDAFTQEDIDAYVTAARDAGAQWAGEPKGNTE